MFRKYRYVLFCFVLLNLSMGGCRRQSGLAAVDTVDSVDTVDTVDSIDSVDTVDTVDTADVVDTETAGTADIVDSETTGTLDTVDTADSMNVGDTATETDSWLIVAPVPSARWRTVLETTHGVEIASVGVVDGAEVIAFNADELLWVQGDGAANRYPMTDDYIANFIRGVFKTEDGLFVEGDSKALFWFANGVWQSVRGPNSVGVARRNHLAVYENGLYAISSWDHENGSGGAGNGFIIRWDGNAWTQVATGDQDGRFIQLYNLEDGAIVAVSGSDVIAVFDGSAWRYEMWSWEMGDVNDVWGLDATDFWVAADSLYHYEDGAFMEVAPVVDDEWVMREFSEIASVANVTGTDNTDLFVNVVYWAGTTGDHSSQNDNSKIIDDPDPNAEDVGYWEEHYLAHYDGDAFTVVEGTTNSRMLIGDLAIWNEDLFLSETEQFVRNNSLTPTNVYPYGTLNKDSNNGLLSSGLASRILSEYCFEGARYDGAAWTCLDLGFTPEDIVSTPNGTVYSLTKESAIYALKDDEMQRIHEPKCSVREYWLDENFMPIAHCDEGQDIQWNGTVWQIVAETSVGLVHQNCQFCQRGETRFGFEQIASGSRVIYQIDGVQNEVTSDVQFDAIACNSTGAVLFDEPKYIADGQRFFSFDGTRLTLLATWSLTNDSGSIYRFGIHDDFTVTAVVIRDDVYYLADWDGDGWGVQAVPSNITLLNFTPDGRLFALDTDTGALLEHIPAK